MSKIERLNARVAKLLAVAVHEVLEVVKETVSEYQEKTARTQRENESLKRRLRELQEKLKRGTSGVRPLAEQTSDVLDEWTAPLKPGPEAALTEEKQVLPDEHSGEQMGEGGGAGESDLAAESETQSSVHGSDCADVPIFRLQLKSDLGLEPLHVVSVCEGPSPSSFDFSRGPSLASNEIKTEADPADYAAAPERPGGEEAQHPSGVLTYAQLHSGYTALGRRLSFSRNVRSAMEGRKQKQHYRKDEEHRCILCGKTFSRIGNLRIHQRCHTGEKPYCCTQCGRCFSQAGDLKKHKRVHTGEKPYYCTQCGKSFSRGENLKRHQKIHIAETLQLHQVWREPQCGQTV